jgi:hypothetical protein
MATKAAAANGLTKADARYVALIESRLAGIRAIRRQIERERAEGRRVSANIRRQHKEIQKVLNRVEA